MLRQQEIISRVPITDYYTLSPVEQTISTSQIDESREYILVITIQNNTQHVLAWRVRPHKRSLLKYQPVKKSGCIPPFETFPCKLVISTKGGIPSKEVIAKSKPDRIQIQGTIIHEELEGDRLDQIIHERIKLHNRESKSFVYQESSFRCLLVADEPTPRPSLDDIKQAPLDPLDSTNSDPVSRMFQEIPDDRTMSNPTQASNNTLPIPLVLNHVRAASQPAPLHGLQTGPTLVEPNLAGLPGPNSFQTVPPGFATLPVGDLRTLKQKARQHDELIKHTTTVMKDRDALQEKLREQHSQNKQLWQKVSRLQEDLRRLKDSSESDPSKNQLDDFSKMFFEDFPKEQLSEFKQPTATSLTMAMSGVLLASLFYFIGSWSRT